MAISFRIIGWGNVLKKLPLTNRQHRKFFKLAAVRYRSEMQERFDKYSRGGGDWPPLKRVRARNAAAGGSGRQSILRDTNTLFRTVTPVFQGLPGQEEKLLRNGISVMIRGGSHPSGNLTVGQIARLHQSGAGHLPK